MDDGADFIAGHLSQGIAHLSIQRKREPYLLSTGYPAATHAFHPPLSAKTFVNPRFFSSSTTRALVASSGHEQ
jgi:hypothetical protein